MTYQWFPGHMAKALRQMKNDLKLVDVVIELVDARVPVSSANPVLDDIAGEKPRVVVMNKADMAEDDWNFHWKAHYEKLGRPTVLCDSRNKRGFRAVIPTVLAACRERIERNKRRGLKDKPIRAMVVGVPNVGKSTFINALSGKRAAKTGNRPGVTKGMQWIRLNRELELLDTPGVMMPKFERQETGRKLAIIGSIKDELIIPEELAMVFLRWLAAHEPGFLQERYGLYVDDPLKTLEEIAAKRGCLKRGGVPDYERTARILLDDFRNLRIGRLTLDREDEQYGRES